MENAKEWAEKIDRFAGVRVLVVGDAMLDRYVRGSVDRISPEAPVPIFLAREEFDRLGGAANVAANVTALGGAGHLVALVGRAPAAPGNPLPGFVGVPDGPPDTAREDDHRDDDATADAPPPPPAFPELDDQFPILHTPRELARRADWAASRLALKCAGQGFTPHFLPTLDGTIVKTRLIAGHQQLLRIDHEAGDAPYSPTAPSAGPGAGPPATTIILDARGRLARARALEALLPAVDVVLVSDYAKGMVDGELFAQLTASGKPLVVDPRPAHRDLYGGSTLVTPNRREAMEMLGLDPRRELPAAELARRTCDNLSVDTLLTLGEEGMLLATRDGRQTALPARAREVFDVTGAGDTVAAAMALGVGAGLPLVDAARIANAAAGVVVGRLGTVAATAFETKNVLASH